MLFSVWAAVCEQIAATSKKLEKAALLRDYIATLSDSDLALAARFFSGSPFALADARVLNVGGALIRDAVLELTGAAPETWNRLVVAEGEAGRAAERLLIGHGAATPRLTLAEAQAIYEQIHAARGPSAKRALIVAALRQLTPLEAAYFIKLMLGGDLRIGLQEGLLEDALARAFAVPLAAVQRANMLLGDIGQTALLARHGRLDEARMRLFHPLKFMLASPLTDPAEISAYISGSFFVEDKYDGIRAQVHKQGTRLVIYSRTLDEITHRFPELHAPLLNLPGAWILDGEIVAARDGRILPFQALQPRLGRKAVDDALLTSAPVVFIGYDILYQDGEVLLDTPLYMRRVRLEDLIRPHAADQPLDGVLGGVVMPSLQVLARHSQRVEALFTQARARGNEGLMIKDPDSPYRPGRRGREWLKLKRALATLDVVVTAAEVGNGNRRRFLSDYTFAVRRSAEDGELLNIGKAYSGLTDAELAELTAWFQAHTLQDFGRVRLVEPRIVLEVAFDGVQRSPRHKGGYALRFPRIVRWRRDKTPDEIDTLEMVRRLAGEPETPDAQP
ncbi:ATP-dependent DNA ligase [Kallotenue papyrolyticum]|uniref:ATP-dependent DNA ligase n=1 Tax=Kallotenue papyrolyticum TaxID=1325125 RepID=UPI00047852F1|nr:ATP-dependent DNA ligase [Kallotenue papyrolyticum]